MYDYINEKPMKKYDFSSMKTQTLEKKVIVKRYMDDYRERIRELRRRLYRLMRMNDEKSMDIRESR